MDEKLKMPSSSRKTPIKVLHSPEFKPEIIEQTECLAKTSTSVGENMPTMSRESMSDVKSKGVLEKELSLHPTADNILEDAKSFSQSVKQLLLEQNNCNNLINILVEQINEMFKMLSNYLNNPTSSPEELVQKLKSLTASRKLINAETYTNILLSFIEKTLKSIKNTLHLNFLTDGELQEVLTLLNTTMKKIVLKQKDHKAFLKGIKKSLVMKLPFPSSVDKEVVNEFHSIKNYMQLIIGELNAQDTYFKKIEDLSNSINEHMPE